MTGEVLKEKRKALNLSQAQLAEKLGVKENTIYRWEKGILPIYKTVELALEYLLLKAENTST